jgi:Mg2+/Co2+ transporter CorB
VVLIMFGEVAPKTYGALYPERLALPAALIYQVLLKVLYPVVWTTNLVANGVLRLMGISREKVSRTSLSQEELRTVVAEASTVIPHRHQRMLMSILDLERISVEDIMVPRNEIVGIDVSDDWDHVIEQLRDSRHTRVPVFDGNLDNLIGILHMKRVARLFAHGGVDREQLLALARTREPFYVPEGTSLNKQLLNFQRQRRRVAFVVDEYGDVQGLVTLEDLLEEIVGEFTSDTSSLHKDVHKEKGGTYVVNASASLRTLNRKMGWTLPTSGPRTLNGLIVEQLETIPEAGTSLWIGDYGIDVLQIGENAVKTVRLRPIAPPAEGAAAGSERGR